MRTRDASLHNALANIPEVAASLGWNAEDHPETGGLMLFDHLAEDDTTFLLHTDDKQLAMIFCWSAPSVYEAHTVSHPSNRNAVQGAKTLIHEMLIEHGAQMVWGQPASSNVRACRFFEKIGATHMGEGHHELVGPITYYGGYKEPWLRDHWSKPA